MSIPILRGEWNALRAFYYHAPAGTPDTLVVWAAATLTITAILPHFLRLLRVPFIEPDAITDLLMEHDAAAENSPRARPDPGTQSSSQPEC